MSRMTSFGGMVWVGLTLVGCGGGATVFDPGQTPASRGDDDVGKTGARVEMTRGGGSSDGDAPEISRSLGEPGGVVVFWPRIIPRTSDPEVQALAERLQQRAAEMAQRALPGVPVDVRPEPERVCPRAGCKASTLGVLLTKNGKSCAAMALVSGAGTSEARIVPWVGGVKIGQDTVRFRDPPENQVKITDYLPCASVGEHVADNEAEILAAIRASAGSTK